MRRSLTSSRAALTLGRTGRSLLAKLKKMDLDVREEEVSLPGSSPRRVTDLCLLPSSSRRSLQ